MSCKNKPKYGKIYLEFTDVNGDALITPSYLKDVNLTYAWQLKKKLKIQDTNTTLNHPRRLWSYSNFKNGGNVTLSGLFMGDTTDNLRIDLMNILLSVTGKSFTKIVMTSTVDNSLSTTFWDCHCTGFNLEPVNVGSAVVYKGSVTYRFAKL